MSEAHRVRAIAFYLPQFHPIPENDEWWGKGFTEWRNVTKARPLFPDHYQPHLPGELGFYDLRLPEARESQVTLAKQYGIHGFCYYHYWFNGRRILERPVDEVLKSQKPDFPFCLCWANENWTRRWDGNDEHILLKQIYSADDDLAHLEELAKYFRDDRYIRVDGKPVLLVYRASLLPNAAATLKLWRSRARELGFPDLYLCNVESFPAEKGITATAGFNAAVEFAPDWEYSPPPIQPFFRIPARIQNWTNRKSIWRKNRIVDYSDLRDRMLAKPEPRYLRFPGVTPGWDNSARRTERAFIARRSTPEAYEYWLKASIARFKPPDTQQNFVFINAWNEWAEGNHLEPCLKWGRAYLESTLRALSTA